MRRKPRFGLLISRAVAAALVPLAACVVEPDDDPRSEAITDETAAATSRATSTAAPALASTQRNLSRDTGVVATASSTYPGYSPARAIDGDTSTALGGAYSWSNNRGSYPQWLQVDFTAPRVVEAFNLYTTATYAIRDYDIQSWDGSSWVTLLTQRGNTQAVISHALSPVTTSAIRVLGWSGPAHQTIHVRVNELELLGHDVEEAPPTETIIDEGPDWQRVRLQGAGVDEVLAIVEGGAALDTAPLPQSIKDAIAVEAPEQAIVISDWVAQDIAIAEATGALTPRLQEIAEPDDGTAFRILGGCSDQVITRSRSVSFATPFQRTFDGDDGAFSGHLDVSGGIRLSASGEARIAKKRAKVLWWCVPYGVKFLGADASGQAEVDQGTTLDGDVRYQRAFDWGQIAKPDLGTVFFWIGPVPVYLNFSLPITAGMRLSASATSNVRYNGSQTGIAAFQVSCEGTDCSGSGSWNSTSPPGQPDFTGELSARVRATPWVNVALRVNFYSDRIAFIQGGARPELTGDLWGYYGNTCGDADSNGVNELVRALTLDLDGTLVITAATSFLGRTRNRDLWSHTWHLLWRDLLSDASGRQPLLTGPSSTSAGASTSYGVSLRPCWPYEDTVTYELAPAEGPVQTLRGSPRSAASGAVAWGSPGDKALSARAVSDDHGRSLDATTGRTIAVGGFVNRNLSRDAGVRATASSTFSGYSPARAIDGNTSTALGGAYSWSNNRGSYPQWLQVEFAAPRVVEAVNLYTTSTYEIQDYDIEAWNGSSWVTLAQKRGNTQVMVSHALAPVTTFAIRVLGLRGPERQTIHVRVNELEIIGHDP